MNNKSLFLKKNTLLLLISSFASFAGNSMHFIALSWFLLEKTNDPVIVGILVSIGIIPGVIISPIVGVLTDRYNKKRLAIVMDVVRGGLVVLLAVSCLLDLEQNILIGIVVTLSLLISVFGNFYFPAITGILKSLYSKDELTKVISANSTLMQVSAIVGAGFSGLLISFSSASIVLFIDALTFFISSACLCFISYSNPIKTKINKYNFSIFTDVYSGLVYSFKNSSIIFFIIIGLLPSASVYIINSLLGVYTKDILKSGSFAYGILDSSFAIGSILIGVTLMFLKKKINQMSFILFGYFFLSTGFIIIGLSSNIIMSSLGFALLGLSIMLINPIRRSLLINLVEDEYIGRVTSLNWMAYSIFGPLLGLTSTIINKTISVNYIFLIFSLISIMSLIVVKFIYIKKLSLKDMGLSA